MTAQAFLALWGDVTARVAALVDAALDVEPAGGLSAAWTSQLKAYAVPALGEDARFAAARTDKLAKGAPIAELTSCLDALTKAARLQLAQVTKTLSPPQQEHVHRGLDTLTAEALRRYRELACARPKKMFGHAKAVAAQHRYDEHKGGHSYVLGCPTCGAPRLADDLSCVFCGGEVAPR